MTNTSTFQQFPNETHQSVKIPALKFALRSTFSLWQPSQETRYAGIEALQEHYRALTSTYGFPVDIPLESMQRATAYFATRDNGEGIARMEDTIDYALSKTSEHIDAILEVSDYFANNGQAQTAVLIKGAVCRKSQQPARCRGKNSTTD